ncbi:hypothetical protein TIFTF001_033199 [Ficus carica]|uniref:Non-specific lipid-transfer protein n=1 Tax=Ficus carica TaxID=3494 RepID=A0AA88DYP2_FICCA|nr:hypothetical protein TIFTF001_033199 [Ficus carica]
MARINVAAIFVLLLLLVATSEAAISCSDVAKDLRPCVNYLVNGSGKPPVPCCAGASALASAAVSSADKKAACECIKTTSKSLKIKADLAQALPQNCGISLAFTISPNLDCSKYESHYLKTWLQLLCSFSCLSRPRKPRFHAAKSATPCVSYLKTKGAETPSDDCCKGADAVVAAAKTKDDKQAACECIKTAAKAIKANEGKAKAPLTKCKVSLPYNISRSMDCSKYYSV